MDNLGIDITLAVLTLFSGIIALLAIRGYILELREGLEISKNRLFITIFCALTLLALTLLCSIKDFNRQKPLKAPKVEKPASSQKPEKELSKTARLSLQKELKLVQDSVAQLELQIEPKRTQLYNRINAIQDSLNIESKQEGTDSKDRIIKNIKANTKIIFLLIGLSIFIINLVVLFLVGDFRSITSGKWYKKWKKKNEEITKREEKAVTQLNELAQKVKQGEYHEALNVSGGIDANKLERLNALDFHYLKNYCGIQVLLEDLFRTNENIPPLNSKDRQKLLDETSSGLIYLLEEAPRMAEAKYLLAVANMLQENYEQALHLFKDAEKKLDVKDIDFAHMKSFCLLHIAEKKLIQADSDAADEAFKQVLEIGVMKDKVPSVLIKNRLNKIMLSYQERDFVTVRENLRSIQTQKLEEGKQQIVLIITEAIEILLLHTENRIEDTFHAIGDFIKQQLPEHFPEPDDQVAEEYIFKSFDEEEMPISSQLFRVFFFLQALSLLRLKIKNNKFLSAPEAEEIGYFLLRALQFDLRNRDVLAALGVLYFWFNPEKREKALEWMDAAINLGSDNIYLFELVDQYYNVEINRQKLLSQFKELSIKYFVNSTINQQLKEELILELGQFQEFKPVLMKLDEISHEEEKSPTIETLIRRSNHLKVLTLEIAKNKPFFKDIKKVQDYYLEYGQLVTQLEMMAKKAENIEQDIMKEIGKIVLL